MPTKVDRGSRVDLKAALGDSMERVFVDRDEPEIKRIGRKTAFLVAADHVAELGGIAGLWAADFWRVASDGGKFPESDPTAVPVRTDEIRGLSPAEAALLSKSVERDRGPQR